MKNVVIQNKETSLNLTYSPNQMAETVILLHGGPGVPYAMEEVSSFLSKNYQVIYFEQRGTGKSICENDSYNMLDYISDVEVIAKYFHLEKFHLFGHSWGGLYAQIYAEIHPTKVKSLFLCSPSSGTNSIWKQTEREVLSFNKKMTTNGEWLKMGWYSLLGMYGSNKAYRKLFEQVYKNYHKGFIAFKVDLKEFVSIFATPINSTRKEIVKYKSLDKVINPAFPITITYGDQDVYAESKNKVMERYPTANFFEIEKCGHIPWLHNPDRFTEVLSRHFHILRTLA